MIIPFVFDFKIAIVLERIGLWFLRVPGWPLMCSCGTCNRWSSRATGGCKFAGIVVDAYELPPGAPCVHVN